MSLREYLSEISIPVFIAVCVFAISSWIDLNGVWVEVPLLVNVLPEGWNLPSYLVIIIQIANVGPLTFTVAKKLAPTKVLEWWVIYVIVSIGFVACILLVFFWDKTTYIAGEEHSTALLVLTLFLALVDCTSSVVFLPYMAQYTSQYLNALYVGEGLSGLLPSIIGLIQGVGKDPECVNATDPASNGTEFIVTPIYARPLFGVSAFFGILVMLMCFSGIAFTLLHFHPKFTRHRQTPVERTASESSYRRFILSADGDSTRTSGGYGSFDNACQQNEFHSSDEDLTRTNEILIIETNVSTSTLTNRVAFSILTFEGMTQLIMIGWINSLTNGVLPSIQSYSSLPYGNLTYNLSVRLSVLVNPIVCLFGLFVRVPSTFVCAILTVVGTVLAGYQLALASLSPHPPLYDQTTGSVLAVTTFVLLTAIFSYVKMSIAIALSRSGGAKGLLWCGGVTQIGSCIGAIIIFILVNVVKLFESKYACS